MSVSVLFVDLKDVFVGACVEQLLKSSRHVCYACLASDDTGDLWAILANGNQRFLDRTIWQLVKHATTTTTTAALYSCRSY